MTHRIDSWRTEGIPVRTTAGGQAVVYDRAVVILRDCTTGRERVISPPDWVGLRETVAVSAACRVSEADGRRRQ